VIKNALRKKEFPAYLRGIIGDDYIGIYIGMGFTINRQCWLESHRGQCWALLWNIAYDEILRREVEDGCRTICYADDTLVLATADEVNVAMARANVQTCLILNRIKRLGLVVAAQKTEVVCFPGRNKLPRPPVLDINGSSHYGGT